MSTLMKHARALYAKVERRVAQQTLNRLRDYCPLVHHKIGTGYGGWFVPTGLLSDQSLCYGVGAGEDISFEVELINRYKCEVHCFDPTPRRNAMWTSCAGIRSTAPRLRSMMRLTCTIRLIRDA
ncbi:MAG: hypothetical protein HC938_02870 [Nitrospira sp.]|nr:hypothetical protein [Nitrospira sp.]